MWTSLSLMTLSRFDLAADSLGLTSSGEEGPSNSALAGSALVEAVGGAKGGVAIEGAGCC
jgi:hypothetical protein